MALTTQHPTSLEHLGFRDAPRMVTPPPGPRSRALLARQSARESNARTYPRVLPIALAEARGATVKDVDGNVYIDCLAGAGTLNVGHNNPFVLEAARRFLATDHVLSSLDFPTEPKDRFTDAIFSIMPPELRDHGRIQFCGPTGSDAVDAAIKLAKIATGRHAIIAFQGAYHGMGQGPLSLLGSKAPREGLGGLLGGVHFAPFAYCHHCPLNLTLDRCGLATAHMLGSMLEDSWSGVDRPAAVIVEAIQGEGGTVIPPPGWLQLVARYARDNDVPLICDEIQSGMGRTGKWFAFEHEAVVPDVVLLSKAIGGIGFPLAVIVYHERLDRWKPGSHVGTFRGNQLAMEAGAAAIEFIQRWGLLEQAACVGKRLLDGLSTVARSNPCVTDVRGRGLMIGVETLSGSISRTVRDRCLARGLIIELGGREDRVIRLLPPLVLTETQAVRIVDILCEVLHEVVGESASG